MARQPSTPEVSVDEIIASIRRIIADDDQGDGKPAAGSVAPASPAVGKSADLRAREAVDMRDILSFPPVNAAFQAGRPEHPLPAVAATAQEPQVDQSEQMPDPSQAVLPPVKPRQRPKSKSATRRAPGKALLSRTAAKAVDREFEALSQIVSGSWNSRLDNMARELMRPMLRVWLDRHLPKLVRQLVREEIARISGTPR